MRNSWWPSESRWCLLSNGVLHPLLSSLLQVVAGAGTGLYNSTSLPWLLHTYRRRGVVLDEIWGETAFPMVLAGSV